MPEEFEITMDDVMASMDAAPEKQFKKGDILECTVAHISKDEILVDIGIKSEAKIPIAELTSKKDITCDEIVTLGEKIKARVISTNGPILSKKSVDYEIRWQEISDIYENDKIVKALVKDEVKGGLQVDLLGYSAFCPASQVYGKYGTFAKHVGDSLEFKIIEIDKEKRKIILSNKIVIQARRDAEKKAFWADVKEGQIKDGVVKSIMNYGAFIDIGGFEGMLHISEMSWNRVKHPSEVMQSGDKIQVYVIKADENTGKVSLGLKQIMPDPWDYIIENFEIDQVFTGKVTKIVPRAVFVDMGNGVEGIIPISEISIDRIDTCEGKVNIGEEVEVLILDIRNDERKITLSKKQITLDKIANAEEAEKQKIMAENEAEAQTTIGEILKAAMEVENVEEEIDTDINTSNEENICSSENENSSNPENLQ